MSQSSASAGLGNQLNKANLFKGAAAIAAYMEMTTAAVFYRWRTRQFGDAVTKFGSTLIGHPDKIDKLLGR